MVYDISTNYSLWLRLTNFNEIDYNSKSISIFDIVNKKYPNNNLKFFLDIFTWYQSNRRTISDISYFHFNEFIYHNKIYKKIKI